MAQNFAQANRDHYVSRSRNYDAFNAIVGNRTNAYFQVFAGATAEQQHFRRHLPLSRTNHPHYLTNILVHRYFYHENVSTRMGFAQNAADVVSAIHECVHKKIPIRTNAYMKSVGTKDMIATVEHIFETAPTFWKAHRSCAQTSSFPIKELVAFVKGIKGLGNLGTALCVQDLTTAGVITQEALEASFKEKDERGRDVFSLLGEGGKEGLKLLVPEDRLGDMTDNDALLMLYKDLDIPYQAGESSWNNVTTVEHLACKLFRFAAFCTRKVEWRSHFWRIIGFEQEVAE